ncbi:MAG: CoA pyrophosphatase [Acidobacteria bacterium]|nr:CoA pyrophosphatase [Acidobacteriota bacterium]
MEDPWLALSPEQRRLTVGEVRARCADLPAPGHQSYHSGVTASRPAASLLPIVEHDGEAAVILTKRPSTMTYHRDDWVLPGGRTDPGEQAVETALREAWEELGIPADRIDIVGELDKHGPLSTGFVLQVFVGIIDGPIELAPDAREVAEVLVVPLSSLMAEGVHYRSSELPPEHDPGPLADGLVARVPADDGADEPSGNHFFTVRDGEAAWGTQGTILLEFLTHLVGERVERT